MIQQQLPLETGKLQTKLEKSTKSYKIFIPESVEQKIRFMCQKIKNIEWSGALFYTHEGNFEDDSLVINCVDIFIMDIGTAGYTEFDMSPDLISYMAQNPELLDCQTGLIHSHHTMGTFFSGTDTNTLREEGNDMKHFVSLIVNNAGVYTAGITRKIKKTKTVSETFSYDSYDDTVVNDSINYVEEAEVIEWFNLAIHFEVPKYSFQEDLETRIDEIQTNKKSKQITTFNKPYSPTKSIYGDDNYENYSRGFGMPYGQQVPLGKGNTITSNTYNKKKDEEEKIGNIENKEYVYDIPYGTITFPKEHVLNIVKQIITGSIIITPTSKLDMNKWANSMVNLFESRFGKGDAGMKLFDVWASSYVEFICYYEESDEMNELGFGDEEQAAILAYDITEILETLPKNKYILCFIEILKRFIV